MTQKERMIAALKYARLAIQESQQFRGGHPAFEYADAQAAAVLREVGEAPPGQILDPVRLAMGGSITHAKRSAHENNAQNRD